MLKAFFWLGLLSVFTLYLFSLISSLDLNKKIYNHRPEVGSEDIALIEEKSIALISSGVYQHKERNPPAEGNIFLYDFNKPDEDPIKLPIVGLSDRTLFRPHGITHWVNEKGEVRIYVISHAPRGPKHSIEVFDYDSEKVQLNHVKTIRDDKIVRPNEILAVGKDKIIFSNDATSQTELLFILEIISYYKGGSLVYYDGKETHWLASGLFGPNGLALDHSGKHLFVGSPVTREITVYEISKDFLTINEISKNYVGTGIDNFYLDKHGAIWTAAHPIGHQLIRHLRDPDDQELYSSSHVLRMKYSSDWKSLDITEVFADDGRFITGSSTAFVHKEKLIIGTMFLHTVVCDFPLNSQIAMGVDK